MQRADHKLITFILYGLGFFLFWEWLRPLPVITETANMDIFIAYAAFAFLLSYLQLPFWITSPAKILALLYALHSLFFPGSPWEREWIVYLFKDTVNNTVLLFSANWPALTDLYRSLLFFILLWLVSYLMHYWLIQARKVFLFFIVTVLYVTILDTFTLYDASAAIVRTVIIGFVLLGLLRFYQIQEQEKVASARGRFPLSWAAALAVILAVTTLVGFAAPKVGPQWPDPVPFIKSTATKYGGGYGGGQVIRRIGYDTNDSRLGGPFVHNDSPVFTVATEERRYWRVETKSIYTGKGWEAPQSDQTVKLLLHHDSAPALYNPGVKTKEAWASVTLAEGRFFPQLVYGGELTGAEIPNDVQLKMNVKTEKIQMVRNGENISLPAYDITYQIPEFSLEQLKDPPEPPVESIKASYTQLPDSLPERVRRLTEKITAEADNRYEKVKAVEQYFLSNGFVYDTEHVAVPGEDEDYVAQFLFDTKRGYCDNFSTSMAVMLRTIGIPTRWVKGFTPGNYQESLPNGASLYEVTNANAHSWVEVYFPGSGWVPFEPTIGFSDIANVFRDYDSESTDSPDTETAEQNRPVHQPPKGPDQAPKTSAGGGGGSSSGWLNGWLTPSTAAFAGFLLLLMIAFFIYRTRARWLPGVLRLRFRNKSGDGVLLDAYEL
ncbi:MAG TPA: transglutaminase-like domain-containing protein, partial [Bacillales bacterium]|nr:transglutaminase-like domain-containing protein [Bacillales bacterium]